MAVAMLPAAFMSGGADRIPAPPSTATSFREVLGQAMRSRPFLVMSGAYFVCGLNLVFITTHLPSYLALCGQDPMLSAAALAAIGGTSALGSLVTGWLGGKYPEARPARPALHPAFDHDRGLFRDCRRRRRARCCSRPPWACCGGPASRR